MLLPSDCIERHLRRTLPLGDGGRRAEDVADGANDLDSALRVIQFFLYRINSLKRNHRGRETIVTLAVPVGVVEVELVGPVVIFMEEDDGLGCEVVDANDLGGLHGKGVTSRTGRCLL